MITFKDSIFVGFEDGMIRCWDISSGAFRASFHGHSAAVTSLDTVVGEFHKKPCETNKNNISSLLVSVGHDCTFRVWDISSLSTPYPGESNNIGNIKVSIVSCSV